MPGLDLIECAYRYVCKIPPAVSGQGGHNATFTVACSLVKGFDLSIAEARPLLAQWNALCAPPWSERELEHKLKQADTAPDDKARGWLRPDHLDRDDGERRPSQAASSAPPPARPVKPEFVASALSGFAARWRQFVDTAWLAERSAILPFGHNGPLSSADYLRAVYREGEKVIVFTNQESQGQAIWPLQSPPPGGDAGVWYLAQPVDGLEHENPRVQPNKDGTPKMSRRSEESVTSWRHLVLESDNADARDWIAALVQLPLRIVAIYTSGGRSIHALVQVDAPSKQEWDGLIKQIRPMLVTIGADPKAMSAVRLTRLPGCFRGDRLQKLLYLNPEPSASPICLSPRKTIVLDHWLDLARRLVQSTPAEVRAQEMWEMVERTRAALRWFETSPATREPLDALQLWMNGGGEA